MASIEKVNELLSKLSIALRDDPKGRGGEIVAVAQAPHPTMVYSTIRDKEGRTVTYCVDWLEETWSVVYGRY